MSRCERGRDGIPKASSMKASHLTLSLVLLIPQTDGQPPSAIRLACHLSLSVIQLDPRDGLTSNSAIRLASHLSLSVVQRDPRDGRTSDFRNSIRWSFGFVGWTAGRQTNARLASAIAASVDETGSSLVPVVVFHVQ